MSPDKRVGAAGGEGGILGSLSEIAEVELSPTLDSLHPETDSKARPSPKKAKRRPTDASFKAFSPPRLLLAVKSTTICGKLLATCLSLRGILNLRALRRRLFVVLGHLTSNNEGLHLSVGPMSHGERVDGAFLLFVKAYL